jgi:hypothetical protein
MAPALFGNGITLGAVLSGHGYMQVTPDAAVVGMFAILVISLLSAIVPVVQALAISPAIVSARWCRFNRALV